METSATKKSSRFRAKAAPINETLALLAANYPEARCALNYRNPWELLVATILSAQCTDERVNLVTPLLFARYPDPLSMAKASLSDVEKIIRSTGFYRSKAKNLIECARSLVTKHGGDVPPRMEELVQLAGVGRKTANVVLGNAFDIASGVVVDTHVTRLSNRLGWVHTRDAVQIERELNTLVPQRHWIMVSHWLIEHGRKICKARSPRCDLCFLSGLCPKVGV